MIVYFLLAILLVTIPFLLCCLWNFARELKPHRPSSVVSPGLKVTRSRGVPISSFRTTSHVIHLQEHSRSVS